MTIADDHVDLAGPAGAFSIDLDPNNESDGRTSSVVDEGTTLESVISVADSTPTELAIEVPRGTQAELVTNDEGVASLVLLAPSGELLGGVAAGDTIDANGEPVATELSLEGTQVVQAIAAGESPAFPVQMTTLAGTVWYAWANVDHNDRRGYRVNANPTALGRQQVALSTHYIHVQHVRGLLRAQGREHYWNWNIEQQFICHVFGAWFPSGVYNMESWQPSLAWGYIIDPIDRCNVIK